VCLTRNAVITSSLNVECCKVIAETVWRILGEQMMRYLLGKEMVVRLHTVSDQTEQHHVHSSVRLLVHYTRIEELLFTSIKMSRIIELNTIFSTKCDTVD